MAGLWRKISFRPEMLRRALDGDFSQATDLAECLVARGVPFREAHRAVGMLVADCLSRKRRLEDLTLSELRAFSPRFGEDARKALAHEHTVARKRSRGSTSPAGVAKALAAWRRRLSHA